MTKLKELKSLEKEIDDFYRKRSSVNMSGRVLDRWDRRGNELMLSPNKRFAAYIFDRIYETWSNNSDTAMDYNGVVIEDRLTEKNTGREVYEKFASNHGMWDSARIKELIELSNDGKLTYKTADKKTHNISIK